MPGYGKRRGDSIIARNSLMREFVIAQIAHNPKVNAPFVLDGIKERFPNDQIPSDDAVRNFMRSWKQQNHSLYMRIEDPAGWKNRSCSRSATPTRNITRVNQLWEADGTPTTHTYSARSRRRAADCI